MSASPPSDLGRYREAIKILVSGLICAWLYFKFRLPMGELAIFFPLSVMRPTVGGSRFNGRMMVLGVVCGVAAAVFASTYLLSEVALLLLFMGVFVTIAAYLGQSPRTGTFGFMAGVMSLILVYAARHYSAVRANSIAFWFCVQVAIAALTFNLVSWLLWPQFARRQIRSAALDLLDLSKRLSDLVLGAFARGERSCEELRALFQEFRGLRQRNAALLADAKSEASNPRQYVSQGVRYYTVAQDLQRQIGLIGGQLADRPDDPQLKALAPKLADVAAALRQRIDTLSEAIRMRAREVPPPPVDLTRAIDRLVDVDKQLLANGHGPHEATSLAVYSLVRLLRKADLDLNLMTEAIETRPEPVVIGLRQWVGGWVEKVRSALDWQPDPQRLLAAVKAFVAAVLAVAVGEYLEVYTYVGMLMVMYAFMGCAMGGTMQAAKRYVVGVTTGVVLALISLRLLAFWSAEWSMFLQLSALLLGTGFMLTGTPGQAFVARQVAISYCLLVLPTPQLTESVFRVGRVASVFGGTAIAFVVSYGLFPVSSVRRLRVSLAAAVVDMAAYFRAVWVSASREQRRAAERHGLRSRLYGEVLDQFQLLPQAQLRLEKDPKAAAQAAQQVEAVRDAGFRLVALENLFAQADARRVLRRLPVDSEGLPEAVCRWAAAQAAAWREEPGPEAPDLEAYRRKLREFIESLGDDDTVPDLSLPDRLLLGSIARALHDFLDRLPQAAARPLEAKTPAVPAPAPAGG